MNKKAKTSAVKRYEQQLRERQMFEYGRKEGRKETLQAIIEALDLNSRIEEVLNERLRQM